MAIRDYFTNFAADVFKRNIFWSNNIRILQISGFFQQIQCHFNLWSLPNHNMSKTAHLQHGKRSKGQNMSILVHKLQNSLTKTPQMNTYFIHFSVDRHGTRPCRCP